MVATSHKLQATCGYGALEILLIRVRCAVGMYPGFKHPLHARHMLGLEDRGMQRSKRQRLQHSRIWPSPSEARVTTKRPSDSMANDECCGAHLLCAEFPLCKKIDGQARPDRLIIFSQFLF